MKYVPSDSVRKVVKLDAREDPVRFVGSWSLSP